MIQCEPYRIAAFYHFATLPDAEKMQPLVKEALLAGDIRGTVLLATEGINGTISGKRAEIDAFIRWLRNDERLADLEVKYAEAPSHTFAKTKVKLKPEIITMGCAVDPHQAGEYLDAAEWNQLIESDDVVLVDTRNDYEIAFGTFQGAINPHIDTFRELPEWLDKELEGDKSRPIAMFCTGGVRCEKSTAYLKQKGFEHVYHLKGGILKYFEDTPVEKSKWDGSCFVFDERISVNHALDAVSEGEHCPNCNTLLYTRTRRHPDFKHGEYCPNCKNSQDRITD